ncbi:hypothetical protein [Chryseobacterium antibioticum]|uniref:hypothetical protein n=1 Tax=Chryseobacterium antibioticum TaxID=2728847 RepID=UPI00145D8149|nr:hypothetical protein [Chryseobacterium antibioticum]
MILQFFFFFIPTNAQTIITGLEYIVVKDEAVMYIDNVALPPNFSKVDHDHGSNSSANNSIPRIGKLKNTNFPKASRNKKRRLQAKDDSSAKIEVTYKPQESGTSISVASNHQIIALNSHSQLKVMGVIEDTKYNYFQILWYNRKISEKTNFFAEQYICYKPSRAPPFS